MLADAKSSLFDFKKGVKSTNRGENMKIMGEHPSVLSKKEYLLNKTEKPSNVINLKPERSNLIDKRIVENDFYVET